MFVRNLLIDIYKMDGSEVSYDNQQQLQRLVMITAFLIAVILIGLTLYFAAKLLGSQVHM